MGEEVEQSVPHQRPHGQGNQELDEVLVEDSLHDGDYQDPEDATQGDG